MIQQKSDRDDVDSQPESIRAVFVVIRVEAVALSA
jgi:hypothetical protein